MAAPMPLRKPLLFLGLVSVVFSAAGTAMCGGQAPATLLAPGIGPCADARDLRLVNGRIVTMDGRDSTVSEMTIQDGRFTAVGDGSDAPVSPCTQEIDLEGRTVVPGLIDNHNHIVLLGIRPGYDVRLESATSMTDVQAAIRARTVSVPAGGFITSMGGWNPAQFAEPRLPTLEELDAAAPEHPVLVFQAFTGPSATNSLGRTFFTEQGIEVSDTGAIGANAPSMTALNALRARQTFDDRRRGTFDAMSYSASVGVTTNVDMGAFNLPGTPDIHESFAADTLASGDQFRMYDALMALHRDGLMSTRVRLYFLTMDTQPDNPVLADRLRNSHYGFGDDMLRFSGIGEFATSWPLFGQPPPTNYVSALQLVAEHGWAFQQHSLSPVENELTASTFETVNKTTPIADLRWSIAHVGTIEEEMVDRFAAIGAGVAVHPF